MRKLSDFELTFLDKERLYVREGTYDKEIVKEVPREYKYLEMEGKSVMDIGCCFGAFSRYALDSGALSVVGFEPDPINAELIHKNLGDEIDFELVERAVVGKDAPDTLCFQASSTTNMGIGTLRKTRGRDEVIVKTINFFDMLEKYKPQVLKIDCEGGEYGFMFDQELPDFVEQIIFEIHLNCDTWREKEAPNLISLFQCGFYGEWEEVKSPKITEKNWHTLGCWRRA